MQKLLTLILCFSLLLLSGCGTTVADIQKYEKENNIAMLAKTVDEASKDKAQVKDQHVEAVKALVRMSSTNKDAEKALDDRCYSIFHTTGMRDAIAPYMVKFLTKTLANKEPVDTKSQAESIKEILSPNDTAINKQIDAVIETCNRAERAVKYNEDLQKDILKGETIDSLNSEIKSINVSTDLAGTSLLRKIGFNEQNINMFSREEKRYLIETSIALNPVIRNDFIRYAELVEKGDKLKERRQRVINLQEKQVRDRKMNKGFIQNEVAILKNMVLGEKRTSEPISSSNKTAYGYISGSDVNVRKSPNTQATVIDCLANDTKVEILDYMHVQGPYNWYKIRLSDGRIGYVAHLYIRK